MWRSPVRRASRKASTVTYPPHQIANGRGCAITSPTTFDRGRPTPQATIEAIMHSVRERGLGALREPATIDRLSRCDADARARLDRWIEKRHST
jgi:hypothetical protein